MDHARAEVSRFFTYGDLRLDTAGRAPFRIDLDVVALGPAFLVAGTFGSGLTHTVTGGGGYQVVLADSGRIQVTHGRDDVRADRNQAAVLRAGDEVVYRHGADYRALAVMVDEQALHDELGEPVLAPALDMTRGAAATWGRMVRLVRDECLAADGLLQYPLIAERMRHVLVAGMALCLPAPETRPAPRARPASIERVVTAIHDEPERPYTVAELAVIGRVGVRTLQEGFRRHLGVSPLAYLRVVRLEHAHQLLRHGHYGVETVAGIAYRCGFAHLGRFSTAYRVRYGRTPIETLRS